MTGLLAKPAVGMIAAIVLVAGAGAFAVYRTHSVALGCAIVVLICTTAIAIRIFPKAAKRINECSRFLCLPVAAAIVDGSASPVQFGGIYAAEIALWALMLVMYEPKRPGIVLQSGEAIG